MEKNMTKSQFRARAKFVKQEREKRAWPQGQLADVAEVSLRTIQRLEKNGVAAYETLMAVADAFEIDVKQLTTATSGMEASQKKVHLLPRLVSGKDLVDLVSQADHFQFEHDQADSKKTLGFMGAILNELRLHDGSATEKLQVEIELSKGVKDLEGFGYYLFGIRRVVPRIFQDQKTMVVMSTLYLSHSRSPKIVTDRRLNMAIPALLSEVAA